MSSGWREKLDSEIASLLYYVEDLERNSTLVVFSSLVMSTFLLMSLQSKA